MLGTITIIRGLGRFALGGGITQGVFGRTLKTHPGIEEG